MDSLKLSNTYAVYKAGQNKFTNWLKHAAATCTAASIPTSSKKSKAKHASILPSSGVQISELQGLANTVAQHLPANEIPYTVLNTLRDVIDRRRESARFFLHLSEQNGRFESSIFVKNDGHLHMIRVLEGVLKVLEVKAKTDLSNGSTISESLDKKESDVGNRYEKLELQQPSVEDRSDAENELRELDVNSSYRKVGKKGKKTPKPVPKRTTISPTDPFSDLEFVLVTDDFDVPFLIHCFLQDINKIRDYLLERWCDYQEGEITLTSISLTTNTAFDLFQRAERDLKLQLPKGTVLENFENTIVATFAADPFENLGKDSSVYIASINYPNWSEEMYEKADWACLTVYQQLKSFIQHFPFVTSLAPRNPPCLPTPEKDYKFKGSYGHTLEAKTSRNAVVLGEFLAEMCALKLWKQQGMTMPVEDELQRGIIEAITSRKLPIWLVFACQIYVDIRYVLEENVDRAHHELHAVGSRIRQILSNYESFPPHHPDDVKKRLEQLKTETQTWGSEKVDCLGVGARNDFRAACNYHAESFFLLRRQPIFCGLLVFRFSWLLQEIGIGVTRSWGASWAAAHLHNVLSNELQGTGTPYLWQDMDSLISIHEASWIFVGERPTKPSDYSRRYELSTGTSIGIYSSRNTHARQGGYDATRSAQGERFIYAKAHASFRLGKRFCGKDNSTQMLSNLEKMFQQVYNKNGRTIDSENSSDLNEVISDKSDHRSTLAHRNFQKSPILSPLQVLDMLCRTLHAERAHLNFDYLGVHQTSTQVLRLLYEHFKEMVKNISSSTGCPPIIQEEKGELPMMARIILGLLSKSDANMRAEIVDEMYDAVKMPIFESGQNACRGMQNMFEAGFPYGPNETWSYEKYVSSMNEQA